MIIGITGGIGSGKSTIARVFAQQGFTVYDCDKEAKRIVCEDDDVRKAIIELLGNEAFTIHHTPYSIHYNTSYVAQRVFSRPELLDALNRIIHPAVKRDILKRSATSLQPSELMFVESAILYETGLDSLCDKVIVVDAPEDIRIARTIARDYQGKATEDNINKVRARMRNQPSVFSNQPSAIYICNNGKASIEELVTEITHSM